MTDKGVGQEGWALTVGSLFSGIGGLDLGLERAGMRVVWQSEIDSYASRVLAKHWPGVPNHGDITKIDFTAVERVDVLCGGFPCQDLSNAGKRAGITGARSGLWSEYVRAIRDLRPRYALVENVSALLSGGDGDWFARVLGDLAESGYDAEWDCIPASSVGAPHRRDRVFVVAYAQRRGLQGGIFQHPKPSAIVPAARHRHSLGFEYGPSWGHPEPGLLPLVHGLPAAVVESAIAAFGNAVVPQVAELIGGWIVAHAIALQEAA